MQNGLAARMMNWSAPRAARWNQRCEHIRYPLCLYLVFPDLITIVRTHCIHLNKWRLKKISQNDCSETRRMQVRVYPSTVNFFFWTGLAKNTILTVTCSTLWRSQTTQCITSIYRFALYSDCGTLYGNHSYIFSSYFQKNPGREVEPWAYYTVGVLLSMKLVKQTETKMIVVIRWTQLYYLADGEPGDQRRRWLLRYTGDPRRPSSQRLVHDAQPCADSNNCRDLAILRHKTRAQIDGKSEALQSEKYAVSLQLSERFDLHISV